VAKAVADQGGPLLKRRKLSRLVPEAGADAASGAIEIGLARELDEACAEIARLERLSSPVIAVARPPKGPAKTVAAAAESADKRAKDLLKDFRAARQRVQEQADRLAAEKVLLSQKLAAKDSALDDARARIKSLEGSLAEAEGEPVRERAESLQNELRATRDRLQGKLDSLTKENARLSRTATQRDAALGDARTRVEYLEAALSAAEAECGRLATEAAVAREKHQAETTALTARFDEMSSRALTAEKLLAETRERLLARIIEIDAVRQRVAEAKADAGAAYTRQRQLEDALCLLQSQFEELERSQSKLAEATKTLLQKFRDRDRALIAAEETIKVLAKRNAQPEIEAEGAGGHNSRHSNRHDNRHDRSGGGDLGQRNLDEDDTAGKDWAELARLLTDFVDRKRQSCEQRLRAASAGC